MEAVRSSETSVKSLSFYDVTFQKTPMFTVTAMKISYLVFSSRIRELDSPSLALSYFRHTRNFMLSSVTHCVCKFLSLRFFRKASRRTSLAEDTACCAYFWPWKRGYAFLRKVGKSVVWWSKFLTTDPEVRVRFPALPDFLRSSGSGTGFTQPREYNWGATWKKN
jgi:hypothetical protein